LNTSENKTRFGGYGGCVGVGSLSPTIIQFFMKTLLSAIVTMENKLGRFLPRKIWETEKGFWSNPLGLNSLCQRQP
jgi:hypothetical protein